MSLEVEKTWLGAGDWASVKQVYYFCSLQELLLQNCRKTAGVGTLTQDATWMNNGSSLSLFCILRLKADRPHRRNYLHTPTDYRHTDKHLGQVDRMDRWTEWVQLWERTLTDRQTDRQTDGTKYIISLASRSITTWCTVYKGFLLTKSKFLRGGPQLSSFSLMIIPIITFRPPPPLPLRYHHHFYTRTKLKGNHI